METKQPEDLAPNPATPASRPEPAVAMVGETYATIANDPAYHYRMVGETEVACLEEREHRSFGALPAHRKLEDHLGLHWCPYGVAKNWERIAAPPPGAGGVICIDCGGATERVGLGRYFCGKCMRSSELCSGEVRQGKVPNPHPGKQAEFYGEGFGKYLQPCGLRTRSGIPCDLLPHQHKGKPCEVRPKPFERQRVTGLSEADLEREAAGPWRKR